MVNVPRGHPVHTYLFGRLHCNEKKKKSGATTEIPQQLHNQQCKNNWDDALPPVEARQTFPMTIRIAVVGLLPKYQLWTRKLVSCSVL
jgi:hypothetical protein